MKAKSAVMLVVALGLGLLATLAVSNYLEGQKATASTDKAVEEGQVVVAAVDISAATALDESMLKVVAWPKEYLPSGVCVDLKTLVGRTCRFPMVAGDPILDSKLAPAGTHQGLSAMIPEGMRAITVKVNAYSGVAGFIRPGARVDVLVTLSNRRETQATLTKTILQGVRVLAVDQNLQSKSEEGDENVKGKLIDAITLLVTPKQAEVVGLAESKGQVHLVLRSNVDDTTTTTAGMTMAGLVQDAEGLSSMFASGTEATGTDGLSGFGGSAGRRVVKEIEAQDKKGTPDESEATEKPIKYIVQVIRGSEVSESAFDLAAEPKP